MRAPTAALVQARARAPLPDLQALHLSSAGLGCLERLEVCRSLRSLYANDNLLKTIDSLTAFRRLWHLDLSENVGLHQLAPLAAFAALGFVHLERNQLTFSDLVPLRDVHILELRLAGNRALCAESSTLSAPASLSLTQTQYQYMSKVVALLPCVWTLDGHFVGTQERAQACDTYDEFVSSLLENAQQQQLKQHLQQQEIPSDTSTSTDSIHPGGRASLCFQSTSELWDPHPTIFSSVNGDDRSNYMSASDNLTQEDALELLDSLHKQPTRNPQLQDLHRLRTIAQLYDREARVHNAHCHFAPLKWSVNARSMPSMHLHSLTSLPRTVRLHVAVILVALLEFVLPVQLVDEALTITLLGVPLEHTTRSTAAVIEDVTRLPPYGITAIVSVLRHQALEEEDSLRRQGKLMTGNATHTFHTGMWKSLPPIFTTMHGFVRSGMDAQESAEDDGETVRRGGNGAGTNDSITFAHRCVFALSLFSNAASFPSQAHSKVTASSSPISPGDMSKTSNRQMPEGVLELIQAAKPASMSYLLDEVGIVVPCVVSADPADGTDTMLSIQTPTHSGNMTRSTWTAKRIPDRSYYRKPWNENNTPTKTITPGTSLTSSASMPTLDVGLLESGNATAQAGFVNRRLPRPGEWLEVRAKVFLKIRALSPDSVFLTASPPTNASSSVTIRTDCVARVSSSMWRLLLEGYEKDEILATLAHATALSINQQRLGRLHRENDAYHRHGAARNQGFPNWNVTQSDLCNKLANHGSSTEAVSVTHTDVIHQQEALLKAQQPQPVEVFSANDTLDANYVVTSPALIALQNACATRDFQKQQRAPAGIWSPIKMTSFHVVPCGSPVASHSPIANNKPLDPPGKRTRQRKVRAVPTDDQQTSQPQDGGNEDVNDWHTLQQEMRNLLGLPDPAVRDGNCFITAVPPEEGGTTDTCSPALNERTPRHQNQSLANTTSSSARPRRTSASVTSPLVKSSPSTAKPARLAALPWKYVATKPQMRVASSDMQAMTVAAPLASRETSSNAPKSDEDAASSVPPRAMPLRLSTCTVSLPTLLPLSSQNTA